MAIAIFIRTYVLKLKERTPPPYRPYHFPHFLNFTLKSRSFPCSPPHYSLIPQPQQDIRPTPALPATTRKIRHIRITRERLRNLLCRLNATDLDQPVASFIDGPRDGLGRLGLALGADDGGLALLLGLLDDEACALGVLLCDLLLLDRLGEFAPECHVCDGDVFERDVEFLRALEQVGADAVGDLRMLAYGGRDMNGRVSGTCSRCVMSSAASNWATIDLRTSFPIEGRTRSS